MSLAVSLIVGDACDILLISVIYLIIMGASMSLTPNPQPTMKGNQGTPVPAYNEMSIAAVALKTGAPYAQMKGSEYTLGCLTEAALATSAAAAIDSCMAAVSAWIS